MLNVLCLKHGTKYGAEYVNKLYNMIERHITVPHRFVCFTDNPANLNSNIEIRILPQNGKLSGWWWKTYLFKQGHFEDGDTNLFFDLDMVIIGNIDNIATYMPTEFVGLMDVGRVFQRINPKLGSAVIKWPANQYADIWDRIESNPAESNRMHGDQDWIWHLHHDKIKFFPEIWIQSYKWEIRSRDELVRHGGKFVFNTVKNPTVDPQTNVLAFHGTPNPEDVMDPVIVDNWH